MFSSYVAPLKSDQLVVYFQDLKGIVLEVSKFLGKSLPDSVIDQIVAHSSFKSMKANPMSNPDTLKFFNGTKPDGQLSFMRKGAYFLSCKKYKHLNNIIK